MFPLHLGLTSGSFPQLSVPQPLLQPINTNCLSNIVHLTRHLAEAQTIHLLVVQSLHLTCYFLPYRLVVFRPDIG
jgi:hypothetical protein